jgi:glucose-6-phosphate isomerase
MKLPAIQPTGTPAWKQLQKHYLEMQHVHMRDLFSENPTRGERFSLAWNDFFLDYSKNRITEKTLKLLVDLARQTELDKAISLQFEGATINETENRAALHTALRDVKYPRPEVSDALAKMKQFSEEIISGEYKGVTGKAIDTIVNIGIGGSDLGPKLVVDALRYYRNHIKVKYLSNVDGDHGASILREIDPETTVFIVVSKSFGTQETLANASLAKQWISQKLGAEAVKKHFAAVSANPEAVVSFGIDEENQFPIWEWVGGRFSLWSAVGLSACCAIGFSNFKALLQGAHEMDLHFKEAAFEENMPVLLALISIWYVNFFKCATEVVIPYSQDLKTLVPYLQQVAMESNGKHVDRNGEQVQYPTCPVVWGNVGTNAQHAFFQLLHQGTHMVPADFILFKNSLEGNSEAHAILSANCLAQSQALMMGAKATRARDLYRHFEGNKPSNSVLVHKLTPRNLGSLLALYEHKYFVQGIIWNIFSFDQWGVELGKKIAKEILDQIKGITPANDTSYSGYLQQQLKK